VKEVQGCPLGCCFVERRQWEGQISPDLDIAVSNYRAAGAVENGRARLKRRDHDVT
jgi:hypothetical protein